MKKMTALLLSAALLCPTLALAEDTVKIGIFEPMTGATAAGGSRSSAEDRRAAGPGAPGRRKVSASSACAVRRSRRCSTL